MEKALQKSGFIAFYQGKQKEVFAFTKYAAQKEAAHKFKVHPSKMFEIALMVAESPLGVPVIHSGAELAGA